MPGQRGDERVLKDRKKQFQNLQILCSLQILLFLAVLMFPCMAEAETMLPDLPARERIFLEKERFGEEDAFTYAFPAGTKISKLKSTNAKVAVPAAEVSAEQTAVSLSFRKAGSSVISFTAKLGKEKKTYKVSFTIAKYTCPVKSLKVGSLDWTRFFKESPSWSGPLIRSWQRKMFRKNRVIQVKAAKGYALGAIYIEYANGQQAELGNGGRTAIAPGDTIIIQMRHKKTGAISELVLRPEGGNR